MGAIITPAQFRDFYPGLQGTGEDSLLTRLINYVDSALAVWCGNPATTTLVHTWTSASYDLRFDGPMKSQPLAIDLESRVLSTASAALTAGYADSTWAFTTALTLTDLDLDKPNGRVWLIPTATSAWADFPRANRIQATGGFATTPDNVIEAASIALKSLLEGGTKPEGLTNLSTGPRSLTRASAARILPPRSMELMAPWRGGLGG